MNVYILTSDADRYEALTTVNDDDVARLNAGFKGASMTERWVPIPVEKLIETPRDAELPPSDFPTLDSTPVFSAHAIHELDDLLDGRGELLPLLSPEGEYYAFNVLRVIDVLDEEASSFKRFRDGRVMNIAEYAFLPERLKDETIFKLPPIVAMYEFVTDPFVERVRERGLEGFLFRRVWQGPDA